MGTMSIDMFASLSGASKQSGIAAIENIVEIAVLPGCIKAEVMVRDGVKALYIHILTVKGLLLKRSTPEFKYILKLNDILSSEHESLSPETCRSNDAVEQQ